MENLDFCPIPYLILDRNLTVLDASESGYALVHRGDSFLTILEEESAPKFARVIHKERSGKMEVNVKKAASFELVDLFYQFSDVQQRFYMAVISKANEYEKVSTQLNGLFNRLGESNIIRKDTNHREVLASVSSLYMKLSNTREWNRNEVMDRVKEIEILLMKNVQ
ncbi:hypothetical protein LCM10_13415 [Rossellomorea aquimaris]|uniref:hypothetical protein n=1 Tax=Rossellomorea aquimaris TaxID=189382 RepID=UPI001CD66215|nr:hypothetical protein [Rossellomorea aquimaris]MCA1055991.1 hypothetical protein [Rossellomorea aquimaris]